MAGFTTLDGVQLSVAAVHCTPDGQSGLSYVIPHQVYTAEFLEDVASQIALRYGIRCSVNASDPQCSWLEIQRMSNGAELLNTNNWATQLKEWFHPTHTTLATVKARFSKDATDVTFEFFGPPMAFFATPSVIALVSRHGSPPQVDDDARTQRSLALRTQLIRPGQFEDDRAIEEIAQLLRILIVGPVQWTEVISRSAI